MILIMQQVDKVKIKQYHKKSKNIISTTLHLKKLCVHVKLTSSLLLVCVEQLQACAGSQQPLCAVQTGPHCLTDLLCRQGALCTQQRIKDTQLTGREHRLCQMHSTHRGEDGDNIVTGPLLILVPMPLYIYTNADTCSNDSSSYFFQLKHHSWVSTEDHLS